MSVALREALASPARLEALYASDLVDPAPDEAFDRLTRMTAGAMAASVACVTAADADWLYVRSQWGFPRGQEPQARRPLEYSVCTHVAATDSPVVLADVRQDPRFRESTTVGEWNIVAYAGVPLHAPGGEAIGTLSAIDHQPREWTVAELQVLLDYAQLLETELASRAELVRRSAAQAALQESEQRYRQLFDSANDGLVTTDLDGTITDVNESAVRNSGRSREGLIGSSVFDLMTSAGFASPLQFEERGAPHAVPEGFDALLQRAAAGETVVVPDVRFSERQTGRSGWMKGTFTPLRGPNGDIAGVIARFSDTTERKRTELALIQAQKMESLGVLAGGVAHDFNNLLTAILGFAGLLKRSPGLSRSETDNLNLIESAARRGAELTGRLLAFARGGLVRFVPLDLRDVVAETLQLAEPGMHSNLVVRSDVGSTPVMVEGDHGQLQQALLNIVLNARDAMPGGGEITVRLRANGGQAVLVVGDNGPGMSEETRVRIFEPFFTTKPLASGTGLGLAITYGIVQGHGGTITVVSQPGQGSTFTISLPLTLAQPPPRVVQADADPATTRLLLVDDDDLVRRALGAILVEMGYTVTPVSNGRDAIEAFAEEPTAFSAVLLDLVMPGLTGGETFRRLTAISQDVPIIVVTGYAADDHIDSEMKRRVARLIQKPFTRERLAEALAAVGALPRRRPEQGRDDPQEPPPLP